MQSYKAITLHKQALLGKGVATKWLQDLLKKTVNNKGRSAFIQGVKHYAGEHPLTQAGRFLNQQANTLPPSALLKDSLNKFLTRPQKIIDWAPKQGAERIKKSIYNSQGSIKQLLNRLSRRTMWLPDKIVTYTDHPVNKAKDWLTDYLRELKLAEQLKKNPNYNPLQSAIQKLRNFIRH